MIKNKDDILNNLMFKDLILLIFDNPKNAQYFKKHHSESLLHQVLLNCWLKLKNEKET